MDLINHFTSSISQIPCIALYHLYLMVKTKGLHSMEHGVLLNDFLFYELVQLLADVNILTYLIVLEIVAEHSHRRVIVPAQQLRLPELVVDGLALEWVFLKDIKLLL